MTDLRPYQSQALSDLRTSLRAGNKSPLLVLPCGGGKTHIAKSVIEGAVSKGKQVLFLAPRRELIYQTADKLFDAGIPHGIIMAGEQKSMLDPVQVGCVPTVHRRLQHTLPPPADIVIIDEAHLSISKQTMGVLDHYPDAVKIGLTATPARTDGRGLGEVYDDIVLGPSVSELIDGGFLVEIEYYAPSAPDLHNAKMVAGDYSKKDAAAAMDPLIGDVVTNWARIASDRPTVVFTVNVAQSRFLREEFQAVGVSAEHIDAKTPNDERRDILARLHAGDVQVITNCDILSYGWDCPPISCAVLARPTKSVARYLQAAGRVLRPHEGKQNTIIIDHTGVIDRLGFVEDEFPWTLNGKGKVAERTPGERKKADPLTCPECSTVFEETDTCPNCGYRMVSERKEAIEAYEADLGRIEKESRKVADRVWTKPEKQRFYSGLLHIATEKGYKQGWAANQYRAKFGVWPNAMSKVQHWPTVETRMWVKSRAIAYAQAKRAAEKRQPA